MFWLIATALTLIVCAPLALTLLRGGDTGGAAEKDIALYKDQLKEIDRDIARGTIAEAEAEATRTEVARRLLAADKRAQAEMQGGNASQIARFFGVMLIALTAVGGGALYWQIGAPGYQDMPLQARLEAAQERQANRPRQAQMEALVPTSPPAVVDQQLQDLAQQLRVAVADRPSDAKGLRLLANTEMRVGNFRDAHAAQAKLVALLGEEAQSEDWADLAEYMVFAAAGYVSPEAEQALSRALRADQANLRANYYWGLMRAQAGRPDRAYRVWSRVLEESEPSDPWVPLIKAQLPRVALAAGIPLTDPTLRGPDALDVASAQDLGPEERQDMILGMVASLSDRLATQGGSAQEWAQLIRALGVLGETARASQIWQEAQTVFSDDAVSLALLREAAQAAEVAQ